MQLEPKELIGRRLGRGRSLDSADALSFIAWHRGGPQRTLQVAVVTF